MEEKNRTFIFGTKEETARVAGSEESIPAAVGLIHENDWTVEEEASAKRKVDFILLPILCLAFFALQMDRGNLAQALTDTITKDLHINTNQINIGSQLLSAGIVLLEIPSNILMQKVGPQKWLSAQIITWGIVATLQSLIKNFASYLTTRLLLGLCEAGFIPGALYVLSTWYTKGETSLRVSIFFLGNLLSSATTALIGAGILTLAGKDGLAGWRWLFLVEGILTIAIGIIFALFLPPQVGNGRPLASYLGGWSYFTARESHILIQRVILDDPTKANVHAGIPLSSVRNTVTRPRILLHVLITLSAMIPVMALATYSPSILQSFGFSQVKANALYSVGLFSAAILMVLLGYLADRTKRRGPFALIAATWSLIAYAFLRQTPVSANMWRRFAVVTVSNTTNTVVHIVNVGWLSVNCTNPQQRSIAMAMIIMAANAAGIAGSQVFRTQDKPLYHKAFTVILSMAALSWALVVGQMLWYYISNRSLTGKRRNEDKEDQPTGWRWTW